MAYNTRLDQFDDEMETVAQVIAAKPSADYDADWGAGFLTPEQWLTAIYPAL